MDAGRFLLRNDARRQDPPGRGLGLTTSQGQVLLA